MVDEDVIGCKAQLEEIEQGIIDNMDEETQNELKHLQNEDLDLH